MAIEASRQLANANKVLRGFKFKDVTFHHALLVPQDSYGIESYFYLRLCPEMGLKNAHPEAWNVGDRVFGICLSGGVETHSRSVDGFLAKLSEDVDWTVAATIPVAYTIAYAALYGIANARKGDKILI